MRGVVAIRVLGASAAAAACAASALLLSGVRGAQRGLSAGLPARAGILVPSSPREKLPFEDRTVTSTNWSGYAVTSKRHGIKAVSGSFVVPKVGASHFGFAATWAGIGGYRTSDLIQAGTGEDSNSNGVFGKQYFAWYELLPGSERPLHNCIEDSRCRVRPGDRIAVNIRNSSGDAWTISVVNSRGWHWSRHIRYYSSRSSAEWILEAPTVQSQTRLAGVGTVRFGPTSTYVSGGSRRGIAAGHPIRVVLKQFQVGKEATPSSLAADGQSFNDCAYHSGPCPRP